MLSVQNCAIPDIKIIQPKLFHDSRGFVAESFSQERYAQHGITRAFVQENISFSEKSGTLRGLHFQKPPHSQAKLIQVLHGKIFDVAVDLRNGSPTYGQHVSITLSADDPTLFYIPRGFAHGFYTLEDRTTILYKMDDYYAPASEGGMRWDDQDLAIDWPLLSGKASLSEKDEILPSFKSLAPMEW